jgi:glyoxylase-like metal-dependent hydrolase (beta-lactamase superfamily II)/8-oxo-dGTP pyrophosphatase MutT (NUDIX family)
MKESVSAVFTSEDKIFLIKRQNYLSVFPGYFATPGGKVDFNDKTSPMIDAIWPSHLNPQLLHALIREVQEELNYDLLDGILKNEVISIDDIGIAITPEFNPYRFKNYYIKISLSKPLLFDLDLGEVEFGNWDTAENFLEKYYKAEMLAVPPAITLLKTFALDINHNKPIDLSLPYDPNLEVPMIESLAGVRQFLPLSNTFPPANRTNSFIIGDDDSVKYLIDPSPKNKEELEKFINSVSKIGFDKIFLTHHHADHYQFSREIALKFNVSMEMSEYTYNSIKSIDSEYFKNIDISFRSEGEIITKSLGQNVRIYEVPGHDEGQLALAPDSMNWFLAGDLIQTIGTVLISSPEGDMKKYFNSLTRIIKLNPKNIIPSHGIIVGGTHKISTTLEHRQKRESEIILFLKEGKSNQEILDIIYVDLRPELLPYAMKTLESHVKKIQADQS